MKINSLKLRIFLSFFSLIVVLGVCIALLGAYIIKKNIIEKAQEAVRIDLQTARSVYDSQIDSIATAFDLVSESRDIRQYKDKIGLDYVLEKTAEEKDTVKSAIVRAAFLGTGVGGTRIAGKEELLSIDEKLFEKTKINIIHTPKAKLSEKKTVESAMVIEYAMPVKDKNGVVSKVIYGGKVLNNDFSIVDKIRTLVFEQDAYENESGGTVTIFQDDVRISTNVLTDKNKRAIGTRVSENVYKAVIEQKRMWVDRAFVVNAWYLTAYEPIKDIEGNVIGILYVGILEKPFVDTEGAIVLAFFTIITAAGVLAAILALILTATITSPLTRIIKATKEIASGDLTHKVSTNTAVEEFKELADSFNNMAVKLEERQNSLKISNEKLAVINSNYIDLVGFVSHELKGILSSIVLNAYNLRKEFLGPMNEAQKKALVSVSRNLDYLSATVKNFLNLSRIEKDEIMLKKTKANIKEQVFDVSVESFIPLAGEKGIKIEDRLEPDMVITADVNLLQIVVNNLISNAIKYGDPEGRIIMQSKATDDGFEFEVYNDGRPIASIDVDKLFKKFSRLIYAGAEKVKGTGIGLFITRKIIEQHGGTIWVEPKAAGNSFKFTIKKED